MDLDDLLVLTVDLLQREPSVRGACRAAHSDIVVDEFQDVNPVQQSLLSLLAPPNHNIVVVGDDDQAIYSWRQALPQSLVAFQHLFPGCQTVTLQTNFRSSRHIVRAANALIRHNAYRLPREMQTDIEAGKRPVCVRADDEVEEADSIAATAKRIHVRDQCAWEEIAVLFRLNSLARVLEDACLRHGVPCQIQARFRFYDRPEVRHALAYIRLAIDQTDTGAAADLISQVRGMGPARLARFQRHLEAHGRTMAHVLHGGGVETAQLPDGMKGEVLALSEHVSEVRSLRQAAIPSVVDAVIRCTQDDFRTRGGVTDGDDNFLAEIASIALDVHQRRGTLRSLVELLDHALPGGTSSGGVRLLSLHAAKGLEFHTVFLCGLEEGILPYERALGHAQAVEEERRLCYVGMTRARRQLILSHARRRTISGESIMRSRSRFIGEIGLVDLKFVKPLVTGSRSQQRDTVDNPDSIERSAGDTTHYV
ncbi:MAG: hypothetical protein NVS2B16_05480 [Chloroflexota bacterium]